MPVSMGVQTGPVQAVDPDFSVVRYWYVSDKNGNWIKIDAQNKLDAIIAQMTPQEYEIWKNNYRFIPILNTTGNPWYSGTDEALA
jgi:hypothetical protein